MQTDVFDGFDHLIRFKLPHVSCIIVKKLRFTWMILDANCFKAARLVITWSLLAKLIQAWLSFELCFS